MAKGKKGKKRKRRAAPPPPPSMSRGVPGGGIERPARGGPPEPEAHEPEDTFEDTVEAAHEEADEEVVAPAREAEAEPLTVRERALQRREAARRRTRNRWIGAGVLVVLLIVGAFGYQQFQSRREVAQYEEISAPAGCGKVQGVGGLDRTHTQAAVEYETSPPAGGAHNPSPLGAGTLSEPLSDDPNQPNNVYRAVHSLEHGYVIVWHDGLDEQTRRELETALRGERKVIVAPYPPLEEPNTIALTSWGQLQYCQEVDTEVIGEFVDVFRERGAPEPAAP